jgi:hypothetical protein
MWLFIDGQYFKIDVFLREVGEAPFVFVDHIIIYESKHKDMKIIVGWGVLRL